jgi:hypothetical protein
VTEMPPCTGDYTSALRSNREADSMIFKCNFRPWAIPRQILSPHGGDSDKLPTSGHTLPQDESAIVRFFPESCGNAGQCRGPDVHNLRLADQCMGVTPPEANESMPHSLLRHQPIGPIGRCLFAQFQVPWVTLRSDRTVNSKKCS